MTQLQAARKGLVTEAMKLGEPVVSATYAFTTLGAGARAHFCMMSDTHAQWKPFGMIVKKIKELAPAAVV